MVHDTSRVKRYAISSQQGHEVHGISEKGAMTITWEGTLPHLDKFIVVPDCSAQLISVYQLNKYG